LWASLFTLAARIDPEGIRACETSRSPLYSSIHVPNRGHSHFLRLRFQLRPGRDFSHATCHVIDRSQSDSSTSKRSVKRPRMSAGQESLQELGEMIEVNWLRNIFIAACCQGFSPRFGRIMRRHGHDWHGLQALLLANLARR